MRDSSRIEQDLKLAHELADLSDQITLSRFQSQDLRVETKADMTLVSDADRATEDAIRSALAADRPDDSVLGEERGVSGTADRRWIIDPIDGTNNFVRGVPVWATLIALVEDHDVVVGVVSAPSLGRRWWAGKGLGAFSGSAFNKKRQLAVSGVSSLQDAYLSYSSLTGWQTVGKVAQMNTLMETVWRTRGFGDFWSYMLVAEGGVDIAAEPELELYDMAALVPIVTEAGGVFTSLDGEPGPWGGNALVTNGLLHEQVLETLRN